MALVCMMFKKGQPKLTAFFPELLAPTFGNMKLLVSTLLQVRGYDSSCSVTCSYPYLPSCIYFPNLFCLLGFYFCDLWLLVSDRLWVDRCLPDVTFPEGSNFHVYEVGKLRSPEKDEVSGHLIVLAAMRNAYEIFVQKPGVKRPVWITLQRGRISWPAFNFPRKSGS
jgi:hypothetical protein